MTDRNCPSSREREGGSGTAPFNRSNTESYQATGPGAEFPASPLADWLPDFHDRETPFLASRPTVPEGLSQPFSPPRTLGAGRGFVAGVAMLRQRDAQGGLLPSTGRADPLHGLFAGSWTKAA